MTWHGRFSVIIPTLQRSDELYPLVNQCAAHPLVAEVLVINNAEAPLSWASAKVRVLQQEQNLFVNPSWNLGARQAQGEYLAIVNDDVRFPDEVFDHVAKILRRGWFGIVGPERSSFSTGALGKPRHRLARPIVTPYGYGTFMALRTRDYSPIPEQMRIWAGDDWLIARSARPPAALMGFRFDTTMSTTAGSPEFQTLRAREQAIADEILPAIQGTRWWHGLVERVEQARNLRYRLSRRLKR